MQSDNMAKKIMIVDDEEGFVSMLKEALEVRGFDVVGTTNAVEAGIRLMDRPPSLIVMDIKMPGINGLQACESIKRNPLTGNIPIIIVSALSGDSDVKRALKIGVADYFVKPVEVGKLIGRIKELLNIEDTDNKKRAPKKRISKK